MTPAQLAARLNITEAQVTARGLLDHEFPRVVECLPEPNRQAFLQLGEMLLQAGTNDDVGETTRYDGQRAALAAFLLRPEMAQVIAQCQRGASGGAPGNTPGGAQQPVNNAPSDPPPPTGVGLGPVLLALGLTAAVGAMLWWPTHEPRRNPDRPRRRR